MKVLMQNRGDAFTKYGGDVMQMQKPIPFLRDLGVEVEISLERKASLRGFDVVHLYNTDRMLTLLPQFENARNARLPVVLTPIYNSMKDADNYLRNSSDALFKRLYRIFPSLEAYQLLRNIYYAFPRINLRELAGLAGNYRNAQRTVVANSNYIAVNSGTELTTLSTDLEVSIDHYGIVPYGVEVDAETLNTSRDLFYRKYGIRDFVICVGRIEPLKNQVNFMLALGGLDVPVVFVGAKQLQHKKYIAMFDELLEKNRSFKWLGTFERPMLFSALANAHVVALPSWNETCGMPGLEGGLMNCNIVMTERGSTKWYYQDDVWYCDPGSQDSMRESVRAALGPPRSGSHLRERILSEFTWEKAAYTLRDLYRSAQVSVSR